MLEVSETAMKLMHRSLQKVDSDDIGGKCFRIVPAKDDNFLTIELEEPADSDTRFKFDGRTILALPESLRLVCRERRIDINNDGKLVMH